MSRRAESLTKAERAILEREAPPEVRAYMNEMTADLTERISAYRKVAAAARAEREALLEVRALGATRIAADPAKFLAEAARAAEAATGRVRAIERENADLRRKVKALTAAPAMAVHSR